MNLLPRLNTSTQWLMSLRQNSGLIDGGQFMMELLATQGWSTEEKEHCLEETEASFKNSGLVMRALFGQ